MIYRKRVAKTGFGVSQMPNFYKLEFGLRVWYFERKPVFHNLISITDRDTSYKGYTEVRHGVRPDRVTVYR